MMHSVLQASNDTFLNASNSLHNSVGSSYGLMGVMVLVVVVAVVAVFVGSSVQRIEWLHNKLLAFSRSLYYTLVGLASTVVLSVLVAPVYLLSQADGETQAWVAKAIGVVLVAYVVLTLLGYVVDKTIVSNIEAYMEEEQ